MKLKNAFLVSVTAIALFASATISGVATQATDPASDPENFGPPEAMLFWTPEQKVAGFRNMDKIVWTRKISASDDPQPLKDAPADLSSVQLRYNGAEMTIDAFLERENVAGLLIIKDGAIAYEYYGLGNNQDTPWLSFSVTKSIVSMLVGAAIQDGYIESVDEPITDHLPRLNGSAYDQATIRDVLQMSSGVQWNEDYSDPESDIAQADMSTLGIYRQLSEKPVMAPPGEIFNYNTAETTLVGTMLRSAIGNNLSTYLSEKIWHPFGMEADANWMLSETGGGEIGGCCLSATLRDYGRIGLFALNDGRLADGTPVLPSGWMADATAPSKGNGEYGYLWWLQDGGSFRAQGIFGQDIFIDPDNQLVIALQSAREHADRSEDWELQDAFYDAVTDVLKQ